MRGQGKEGVWMEDQSAVGGTSGRMEISAGEIVRAYLVENGYDGLFTDSCGCRVKDGLCPCDEPGWSSCEAGLCAECWDPEEGDIWVWGHTKEELEQQVAYLLRDGGHLLVSDNHEEEG